MLKSEAGEKWCPMVRIITTIEGNFLDNRGAITDDPYALRTCWTEYCACWIDTGYDDKVKERTGRCGLAR